MIMPLTLRPGNGTDFGTILPMVHRSMDNAALADSCYKLRPDADARLRHWLGPVMEDPRGMLLIAEVDGAIAGFLAATVERTVPIFLCEEYALVRLLWVDPPFRRHGVATALLNRAAADYGAMGLPQIRIRARPDDASDRTLEKARFRQSTVTFVRDLPGGKRNGKPVTRK
jgi:GNAT superfamily N-acetyltransferase